MKTMLLVASPPACGKTYISQQLASRLNHVVYLDKDTLIPLSKQIFAVAGQPYNRSSDFFKKNIRDAEYDTIVALGMEALSYDNFVLINAPFTKEVHDAAYIDQLSRKLQQKGAKLSIVWVVTDPEVCHQRMIDRNSSRDTWKLEHWDEYIKTIDFNVPEALSNGSGTHELILFYNSNDKEFNTSMKSTLERLGQKE